MELLIIAAALLVLAGCAAPQPRTPPDRAIASWVGQPIQAVADFWGAPDAERMVDGRRLVTYRASHYASRYFPANLALPYPATYVGDVEELTCQGVFAVDEAGMVTAAAWEGYECHYLP